MAGLKFANQRVPLRNHIQLYALTAGEAVAVKLSQTNSRSKTIVMFAPVVVAKSLKNVLQGSGIFGVGFFFIDGRFSLQVFGR